MSKEHPPGVVPLYGLPPLQAGSDVSSQVLSKRGQNKSSRKPQSSPRGAYRNRQASSRNGLIQQYSARSHTDLSAFPPLLPGSNLNPIASSSHGNALVNVQCEPQVMSSTSKTQNLALPERRRASQPSGDREEGELSEMDISRPSFSTASENHFGAIPKHADDRSTPNPSDPTMAGPKTDQGE